MELYIIRHAQSSNNALADPTQRVCDPVLTELGRRQAQVLAHYLAAGNGPGRHIDRLYTSPMCRALQTAQPVGRALGLRPEVWIDLHEEGGIYLDDSDGGRPVGYPGKTRPEMLAEFPECVLPEEVTERGWWNRGFEEKEAVGERALRVAAALQSWPANPARIAIVTHGAFVDSLLKTFFGQWPGDEIFYYNYNTAISRLDLHGAGRFDVRYLNRVDHLPLALVS